ncbi:MAG: hypothetical protein M0Q51_02455 [Bacteroidales bacterium]|nr:hypothetical protein [Bacteroidales bacterium]
METIVIKTKNKAELKFWLELIKKTGAEAMTISAEDLEDAVLSSRIEKGMKTPDVSRERVMNALGR